MKAKDIVEGMTILADWSKDWRKHLQMPSKPEIFNVDAISIDNEKVVFEAGLDNKYYGYIMFIQKDGNTITLNPNEEVKTI